MAQVIRRGDTEIHVSAMPFEVKEVEGEDRVLRFIGSDETVDRDNDIIEVAGWELGNYRKNPVFLWAHDYWFPPIGRATKVVKEDGKLMFDILFPARGIFPFADLIYDLYKGKFMRATSVGFIPKKYERRDDDDVADLPEWQRGYRFKKQELLELSAVPVPSNPNALEVARSKGYVTDDQAEALADFLNGKLGCSTKACKAVEGMWKAEHEPPPDNDQVNVTFDHQSGILTLTAGEKTRSFTLELLLQDGLEETLNKLPALRHNTEKLSRLTRYAVENHLGEPGQDTVDVVIAALEEASKSIHPPQTDEPPGGEINLDVVQAEQFDLEAIDPVTNPAGGDQLDVEPETLKTIIQQAVKEELDRARGRVS